MANAVAAVSVVDDRYQWSMGSKYCVIGSLAISAGPATYVTGGIACSLLTSAVKATRAPFFMRIQNQSGFVYRYIPGVDASTGLLKIFVQDAVATNPLLEMANTTAIPAGVSGDVITFFAIFQGME